MPCNEWMSRTEVGDFDRLGLGGMHGLKPHCRKTLDLKFMQIAWTDGRAVKAPAWIPVVPGFESRSVEVFHLLV